MHLGDPNGSASGCMCWIKSTITLEMEVIGTTWKGVPWKIEEQLGGTIQHIIKVICKPEKKKKKKKDDKDFPPNIDADEYELNTYYAPSLGQPLALVLTRYKQCGECKKPPVPCEENKTDFTKPTGKPICDQTWPISGPALANNAMGDLWAMRHHLGTSPPPKSEAEECSN